MWCCVWLFLVVSTGAIDCLQRLISEMTCYVSSGRLNHTHSLTNPNPNLAKLSSAFCKLCMLTNCACRICICIMCIWYMYNLVLLWWLFYLCIMLHGCRQLLMSNAECSEPLMTLLHLFFSFPILLMQHCTRSILHCTLLWLFNPLRPHSNYYTLPYRPNLPFLISDIRALWRSALSARVPECQKLKMV